MPAAKPETSEQAFLITQIGSAGSSQRQWADDVRRHVVQPAVEAVGLEYYRSDLDRRPGPISGQMVRQLAEARVVIADLTGRNPNVYYELGIAHSLTKPVIVLIDDVTALPFDTQDERSIELEAVEGRLTASGAAVAGAALRAALEIVTVPDYRPNNAVVQAGLARHFEELARQGGDRTGVELLSIRQDMLDIKHQLARIRAPTLPPRPSLLDSGRAPNSVVTLLPWVAFTRTSCSN